MNINHLLRFALIVDHGFNITKAAKSAGISQPALSKQMLSFEKKLGVDLLVRNGKHVRGVTTHGEVIYKVAEKVLLLEKAAEKYIETGVLSFIKPANNDEIELISYIEYKVKAYRKKHKLVKEAEQAK